MTRLLRPSKRAAFGAALCAPFLALAPRGGAAQSPDTARSLSTVEIARLATPATATLLAVGAAGDTIAQGSAFFLGPAGVLVSNYHVLAGASRALVVPHAGGSVDRVSVVAADRVRDLAVLRLDDRPRGARVLEAREDRPSIGERVVAIGTPLGLTGTVSEGIVSAYRRLGPNASSEVIQITAPISPGSSGGAVLDDHGRVVAVSTSQLVQGQQLNFAIPIREVLALLNAASPTPRSVASVFAKDHVADDDGPAGSESPGASACRTLGMGTATLGEALGEVRAAGLFAEQDDQRRVLAELEIALTEVIAAEPDSAARRAAWYLADNAAGLSSARHDRQRETDRYLRDPSHDEATFQTRLSGLYRERLQDAARLLSPQDNWLPRCALPALRPLYEAAARAAAF